MTTRTITLAILIGAVSFTDARAGVSLPLEGYFRPGKRVPVRVEAAELASTLQADGAVPTRVELSGTARIVPLWVISSRPGEVTVDRGSGAQKAVVPPWRTVDPSEALVGFVGEGRALPNGMFEGKRIVAIRIESADLANSTSECWENLDALVTDVIPASWSREIDRLPFTVVLRSGGKDRLFMRQLPAFDVAPGTVQLDLPAGIGSEQSGELRWRVALLGALFSFVVSTAMLLQGRRGFVIVVGVCGVLMVAIAAWRSTQSPVQRRWGNIGVLQAGRTTVDRWEVYATSLKATPVAIDLPIEMRPFIEAVSQLKLLNLACLVTDQSTRYRFTLSSGNRLVAYRHEPPPRPADMTKSSRPLSSPLSSIARRLYFAGGDQLIQPDDASEDANRWGTVVVIKNP